MITPERIYSQTNINSGIQDWFFIAREGAIGPFSSKESANMALEEFVKFNSENAWDGGRNAPKFVKLVNKPNNRFLSQIVLENRLELN